MSLTDKLLLPLLAAPAFDRLMQESYELGETIFEKADPKTKSYIDAAVLRISSREREFWWQTASAGDALTLVGLGHMAYGFMMRDPLAVNLGISGFCAGRVIASAPIGYMLSRRQGLREALNSERSE